MIQKNDATPKLSKQELNEIKDRTQEIEKQRLEKKLEREKAKRLKELKTKRQRQEKLVAPILLILTIIVAVLFQLFFKE